MINEDVKVSIIVPSYKRNKEFYARAIESLRNQTYRNIEIIAVDDNAKEELSEYREELSAYIKEIDDARILYIANKENLGSAGSRNAGIDRASGEYIAFLDDDDEYLPNKVNNQIKFMIENGLDMSFTNIEIVNEDGKIIDFREFRRIKSSDNKKLLQYHLTKKITPTDIYMIKKGILLEIGGFDVNGMGDELMLMTKLIKQNIKIGYLDDTQVRLSRYGQESLTVDNNRIEHEKRVFMHIKSNYKYLTFFQRCYCRFRYQLTKAVTYKRLKKYFKMLGCLLLAFFCSPVSFFVEPIRMVRNLMKIRKSRNV